MSEKIKINPKKLAEESTRFLIKDTSLIKKEKKNPKKRVATKLK